MDFKDREQLTADLKAFATEIDIDLIGVAGLDEINAQAKIGRRPIDLCPTAQSIVVFAVGGLDSLLTGLSRSPDNLSIGSSAVMNELYIRELKLRKFLRDKGHKSFPFLETQGIFNIYVRLAQAFRLAGLGYIGKSNLAISKKYGPRIRLLAFFTEAPLVPDQPYTENHCGDCNICEHFCTSKALLGDGFFNARQCEMVVHSRPSNVYFSLTGFNDCDICYRKCSQGEYKWSREERTGNWWDIVQKNRQAPISQHSHYLQMLNSEKEERAN